MTALPFGLVGFGKAGGGLCLMVLSVVAIHFSLGSSNGFREPTFLRYARAEDVVYKS